MLDEATPIAVHQLVKDYGGRRVLDRVSFQIRSGAVTGFIGPNGAGKTTTLSILLGLQRASSGEALVFGQPYGRLTRPAKLVGAALDGMGLSPLRSGRSHLRCFAPLCDASPSRVEALLGLVGLEDAGERRIAHYSNGMKQRLCLATALLGDPALLVLDEPLNGLDPAGVAWLRDFLREFADRGGTVLLSSHLLGELELLADDVVLIDQGTVRFSGPLADLVGVERPQHQRARLESAFLNLTMNGDGR